MPIVRGLFQGPYAGGMCINGDAAGIGNVAQAVRLADAITPSVEGFINL
jgi:hypothetical protein